MTPALDLGAIAPMLAVGGGAAVLPLAEVGLARMIVGQRSWLSRPMTRDFAGTIMAFLTAGILAVALLLTLTSFSSPVRTFDPAHSLIAMDALTLFVSSVVLIGAILTVLLSIRYLSELQSNRGEYYALMLASVLGMMLLVASTNLLMLFLALELMTIPIYALAGYQRRSLASNEAAVKYFVIGSFAAAILVYGSSLVYGTTGSISLVGIGAQFDPENPVAMVGAGLLVIGLAFKVGSVPFHQWAPDVYEGAPTTVTAFMATAVKVAAFGVLLRVMAIAFEHSMSSFYVPLWWMAVLSMTIGNVMAIVQHNVKRMLAYSSIAHAGYALIGICVGTRESYAAVLFYLLAYTFMTLGAFAVVALALREDRTRGEIDELAGLHATRPFFAAVMAISMFALAGIPGTAGFMGKYQLFASAIEKWTTSPDDGSLLWLAVLGVLNSAISLAYYLRIPVVMYMRDPNPEVPVSVPSGSVGWFVLATCTAAVFLLGILPHDVIVLGSFDPLAAATSAAQALIP
jgi:NADH-quinone oxidoreductase subunit N